MIVYIKFCAFQRALGKVQRKKTGKIFRKKHNHEKISKFLTILKKIPESQEKLQGFFNPKKSSSAFHYPSLYSTYKKVSKTSKQVRNIGSSVNKQICNVRTNIAFPPKVHAGIYGTCWASPASCEMA
jgi:hypothetical protein